MKIADFPQEVLVKYLEDQEVDYETLAEIHYNYVVQNLLSRLKELRDRANTVEKDSQSHFFVQQSIDHVVEELSKLNINISS